ncbi:hypothetical protein IT417_02325 [bacterium]|nr:hypothetical protein [bacterium]
MKNPRNKDLRESITYSPPVELDKDFDIRRNSGVFYVVSFDEEKYTLDLEGVWPNKIKSKMFEEVKINCDTGDYSVNRVDKNKEFSSETVTIDKFFDYISSKNVIFLSGACKDNACEVMNRFCNINLYNT